MTTFHFVKKQFIRKINEIGGVEAETTSGIIKAIDLFGAFGRCRGVIFVEELDKKFLDAYRLFLRQVGDGEDEDLLVATAGVLIRTAAENALIPEALSEYWQSISAKPSIPGAEHLIGGPIGLN